ncbi:CsgG/HfaB family protein [Sphingobium sp.]|uniref:CsgG/HfaB family protein n=1 Tax=Sphingobium sp. TaxID=1912891 RepID=UPI0028BD4C0D|nr:CsgG/HfaB family protein [Sphingobium sp.]
MKYAFPTLAALYLATSPLAAQKLGKGGTGVDESASLPQCAQPLGTVALVEDKVPTLDDQLPPGMRALVQMAERQNGGSTARVDPLPLLKLLAARSHCFLVVERGGAFDALQRERALAAGGAVENGKALGGATLKAADYLLSAQLLYSDANSRGGGGAVGGAFGSAVGLKMKTLESQVMLSLVEVKTGLQRAVATGSARKRDVTIVGGGLLLELGVGALGGAYSSTDIGKISSLAMLDAFRKLADEARLQLPPTATPHDH